MSPNDALIEIKPDLYRWDRHDSQPSDEPPDSYRSWTWNHLPAHYKPTT
jgi:hypothetical protein